MKGFVDDWDRKYEALIDQQPAIKKYDLKGKLLGITLEMSPVR